MAVATFGSCFAQHFGHALRDRGFNWMDYERAPKDLSVENAKKFNFSVFSCRTGNIYTTSLLFQWMKWAMLIEKPPEEYWEKNGRIFDPFRPNIEPNGFESVEEMRATRALTLSALKLVFRRVEVFVFTLGLTESWMNGDLGYEYPMCPGTVAGDFDENKHVFANQNYEAVSQSLRETLNLLKQINPKVKVLLTVSPVPLTATNSGQHVLTATSYSKSVLRAAAGAASEEFEFVDYFPSYEIINAPVYRGSFFEPNQRQVNPAGVAFVMENFFYDLGIEGGVAQVDLPEVVVRNTEERDAKSKAVCEEELLAAFGQRPV